MSYVAMLAQGPSKYLLEAVLRTLSSLAASDQQPSTAGPTVLDMAAGEPTSSGSTCQEDLCSWMAAQSVAPVVCLLQHPSGRVQVR